jgi:hypothetical protein
MIRIAQGRFAPKAIGIIRNSDRHQIGIVIGIVGIRIHHLVVPGAVNTEPQSMNLFGTVTGSYSDESAGVVANALRGGRRSPVNPSMARERFYEDTTAINWLQAQPHMTGIVSIGKRVG